MLVVVVSMLNTAPLPVKNIVLQAAVPKVGTRGSDPRRPETVLLGRLGYELRDLGQPGSTFLQAVLCLFPKHKGGCERQKTLNRISQDMQVISVLFFLLSKLNPAVSVH